MAELTCQELAHIVLSTVKGLSLLEVTPPKAHYSLPLAVTLLQMTPNPTLAVVV